MSLNAKLLVLLLVTVGFSSVDAQVLQLCIDRMTQALKLTPNQFCPVVWDYMKCTVKGLHLGIDHSTLQALAYQMNLQLAKHGIQCQFDTQALLTELRQETGQGESTAATTVSPTRFPTGFESATSIGQCIEALVEAGIKARGIKCAHTHPYVKCMVRVMNIHQQPMTQTEIRQFEDTVEDALRKQGAYCTIDLQRIIDEVKLGSFTNPPMTSRPVTPRQVTSRPTTSPQVTLRPMTSRQATIRPVPSPQVTIHPVTPRQMTFSPMTTHQVTFRRMTSRTVTSPPMSSLPGSFRARATSFPFAGDHEDYMKCLEDDVHDVDRPGCENIEAFLKCVLATDDTYKHTNSAQLRELQGMLDAFTGKQCNFDVVLLQKEIQSKNYGMSSRPTQNVAYSLMVVLSIVFAMQ